MSKLINGKLIAKKIEKDLRKKIVKLKRQAIVPKLVVVLVGHDKPSIKYVEKKKLLSQKIGVDFELKKFKSNISVTELENKIKEIQKDKTISGMIVQLPLPAGIDKKIILDAVHPSIDVDCLNSTNQTKLLTGADTFLPPTPAAIMEILKYLKVKLKNKKVAIVGKGILVGKPISVILKQKGAKVTICDSKTTNMKEICLASDIIITGVGKKHIITSDMVHKKSIVIDAGTVFVNKKIYGDVDYKNVAKIAKYTTPVPDGVGPLTVVCLLKNTVENALLKK